MNGARRLVAEAVDHLAWLFGFKRKKREACGLLSYSRRLTCQKPVGHAGHCFTNDHPAPTGGPR